MPKKVYELAEEYQLDSKSLLSHLRELGIFVSSHMSLLDEDEVARVKDTIDHLQKRQEVSEKRIKPTVIRRRVVKPRIKKQKAVEEPKADAGEAVTETPVPGSVELEPAAIEAETGEMQPVEEQAAVSEQGTTAEQQVAEDGAEAEATAAEEPTPKKKGKTKKSKKASAAIIISKPSSISDEAEEDEEEAPPDAEVPPPEEVSAEEPSVEPGMEERIEAQEERAAVEERQPEASEEEVVDYDSVQTEKKIEEPVEEVEIAAEKTVARSEEEMQTEEEMKAQTATQPSPPKSKSKKDAARKKNRTERDTAEPAKILERVSPAVLKRFVQQAEKPAPTPAKETRKEPEARPARPARPAIAQMNAVPPPPEDEASKKSKPKKRKVLKAFDVIHQQKPSRGGRQGKKKDVIQLRGGEQERFGRLKPSSKKKKAKEALKTEVTVPKAIKRKVRISESITVGDLARRIGIKASDVIKKLLELGVMATVNQMLDMDEASLVAGEFGYEIEKVVSRAEEILVESETPEAEEDLEFRPPVVTVMGHVDHGKTSLLDAIRNTHVTDQEMGGITQHIGAYQVRINEQLITFLDTPGHEAFTTMRARGAQVTDIVVLVVAADDGVMNQTREAIDHARAAKVPIVVAVNKIDKANAEPDRVKQELSNLGLIPEAWGGETIFCEVSAKQQTGIDSLLEYILLQSEMLDLKANPNKLARGTVLEAKLDRSRGPVVTLLVQEGTLKPNQAFVAGSYAGKVRTMHNHRGKLISEATPAMPVEITGMSGVPMAGDRFLAVTDEREARGIEGFRREQARKDEVSRTGRVSLESLMEQMEAGLVKELPIVLKGDVQGSIETIRDTLGRMGGEKIKILVIHSSVGGITENDVNLASASNAVIIGFNVRPEPRAAQLADELKVDIRIYNIIYELMEDIEKALIGMLDPTKTEKLLGRMEVLQTFKISRIGTIAGSIVKEGKVVRNSRVRLVRDGVIVHDGKIETLRRFQDEAKEVLEGQDCGIKLENFNDIKEGDLFEVYEIEEVAPEL